MFYEISKWIDNALNQKIPDEVVAFCFNLYEDSNNKWSMEIVGTDRFDVDDEDWCCDEVWKQRLNHRNNLILAGKASAYFVDDDLAKKFGSIFEMPSKEEIDVWVKS